MTPLLLCLGLLGPAVTPAQLPPWYAGRHAVLVVVDGLGGATLQDPGVARSLPTLRQRFLEAGQGAVPLSSLWPGLGPVEAASVAAGEPLEIVAEGMLPPFGLEAWPQAVVSYPADPGDSGLPALLAALPAPEGDALPAVIAVAHEARYAVAVEAHGPGSTQARQALVALDRDLARLLASYQALGLLARTTFALVAPSSVAHPLRRLDAAQVLAPLLPRRIRRDGRLANLLQAFSPIEISQRGGLAFAGPRRGLAASGAELPPSTLAELHAATHLVRRQQGRVLEELARADEVALVVARTAFDARGGETLQIVSATGRASLEIQADEQYRYRVLSGRDPLELGALPADLEAGRFHSAAVWRHALPDQADPLGRIALLLELQPAACLAVVAGPGQVFDTRGRGVGPDAQGWLLLAGAGTPATPGRLRSLDVMPTLRALVGAPEAEPAAGEEVVEALIEATESRTLEALGRTLAARAVSAFSSQRVHDSSVVDTTELRRFGRAPRYFGALAAALAKDDPLRHLPEPALRLQMGPRRSLLFACTRLSARIEALVLAQQPAAIRRFDPLIRPQLMLTGFLADPQVRARLRILEGPRRRTQARFRPAPVAP